MWFYWKCFFLNVDRTVISCVITCNFLIGKDLLASQHFTVQTVGNKSGNREMNCFVFFICDSL